MFFYFSLKTDTFVFCIQAEQTMKNSTKFEIGAKKIRILVYL
jgi:hypothetical protein